jgi:hypothetical protein
LAGHERRQGSDLGQAIKQHVVGTEDHARPQDRRRFEAGHDGVFRLDLGLDIAVLPASAVGADARDMDQPVDARGARRLGDRPRAPRVDGLVALAAVLEGDARGIDHGLAAFDGGGHRLRYPEIGTHQGDLADIARGLDLFGQLDAPGGHPHEIALGCQCPHDGLAQKAAAAENRNLLDLHGCWL